MNNPKDDMHIQLNALADGELSAGESEALLESIEDDTSLREELCDIHRLKDMVRYAYAERTPASRQRRSLKQFRIGLAVAAVALLSIGFMGGRLMGPVAPLDSFELGQVEAQPNKVVLFVGYSDEVKFQRVLDQAERLLREYRDQGVEVNVVASAGGIDLLRKTASPHIERIQNLSENYAALQFVACNNTLARLAREGRPVSLVDSAVIHPSAVQFVVERLKQGWSYMAI